MSLKIIQLSDCHVSASPDAVYRGIDPRATLQSLLPRVRDWSPDLVLLTGDLAEDASAGAYAFLRDALAKIDAPVISIPGNHDDPAGQGRYFPATATETPLVRIAKGWKLIMLNSAAEGRIEGVLSEAMLEGLGTALRQAPVPTMVVLHHQPVPTDSPWIDRYALREPEAFWSIIDQYESVRAVCWGHIHHDFEALRGEVCLLGAPSTSRNSLARQKRFTGDPAGPAARWFELGADGRLGTGLLRPSAPGQQYPENDVNEDAGERC